MERGVIKTIVGGKQQRIATIELVERPIFLKEVCNYIFVGLRRAGESYSIFQHIQLMIKPSKATTGDTLYINFEDERISSTQMEELNLLLKSYRELYEGKRPLMYLDEIQNIEGWEHFVRRLTDSEYRVYITGNDAKILSWDIITTLGGRFITKEIYPFPLPEYLAYKGIKLSKDWKYSDERTTVVKPFGDYFHSDGFPETSDSRDKRSWINSLYLKVLLGSIISWSEVRNTDIIRLLAKKMIEGAVQPIVLSRLQHIVSSAGAKMDRNTIADYIGCMKDAYLVFGISNFTDSLSDREISQKRYFCDNGLLSVFLTDPEAKLLENIMALALMKRYGNEELSYYNKNAGMDFCLPPQKMAVRTSLNISDSSTFERETKVLIKIVDNFDAEKSITVIYDNERTVEVAGILIDVVPVWEWLLNIEGFQTETIAGRSSLTGAVPKLITDYTD